MTKNLLYYFFVVVSITLIPSCGDDDDDDSTDLLEGVQYEMLVSSRGTSSVKRYNGETGEYIDDLVASGAGGLGRTQEVLIGFDGELLVSGRDNNAIKEYNLETGIFVRDFTTGFTLDEPVKMSFGPDDNLYVSQWGQNSSSVVKFDGRTGAFIEEVTPDMNQPMGQAFKDGLLYVVSFGSKDVRVFEDGEELQALVTSRLQGPVNLRFLDSEWLVEDWQDGTIKRFDVNGVFQGNFIQGLRNIEGTAFGPDGNFYACDWGTSAVKRYDPESGSMIDIFANSGDLSNPNSILFRKR